jgi:hypothetical protein
MSNYADLAREKADQGKVRLSHHAQKERLEENISTDDIITALKNGRELEPYPDDPRGSSALIAGQDEQGRWIHVVCGNFGQEYLLIITVYLPELPKWTDPFTRGK